MLASCLGYVCDCDKTQPCAEMIAMVKAQLSQLLCDVVKINSLVGVYSRMREQDSILGTWKIAGRGKQFGKY